MKRVFMICVALAGSAGDRPPASAALADASTEARSHGIAILRGVVEGAPAICTGVLVDPVHVLTAAHCQPVLEHEASITIEGAERTLVSMERHFFRDVLLLTLAPSDDAEPLSIDVTPIDARWVGRSLEGVGAGEGVPEASEAIVIGLDAHHLVVESREHGVCAGDSGGPLFSSDGVIGLVSTGAFDCSGRGTFTRLDAIEPWLRERLDGSAFEDE